MARKVDDKHLPKKRVKEQKPVELEWYQKQIESTDFVLKKDKNGKSYAHHIAWKSHIWIGPYDTEEELSKVISSYVSITKKPFGKRKEIKNIHSVIMTENDW